MTSSCAIIPIREFADGKARLKGVISDEIRESLNTALLKRVVRALQQSNTNNIILVASNADEAQSTLGDVSKFLVLPEKSRHGGVNFAMQQGIEYAVSNGYGNILLLPSDLPMINHSTINEVLSLLERYDLLLNPSVKRDGTNLLAVKTEIEFELHYDDDSFNKHREEATSKNLNFATLFWREFSNDLDDAEDLARIAGFYRADSIDDLIRKISSSQI